MRLLWLMMEAPTVLSALELFSDGHGSPIKVYRNAKFRPSSLNIGIRKSKSPYIIRVDSDDFVNENFLNFMLQFITENSECRAVACDYLLTDDKEKVIKRCNCDEEPIGCGIIFHTKSLLEVGLYNEEFKYLEEKELRSRFEKKFKIERLAIPLYRYRRHDKNITNNHSQINKFQKKLDDKNKTKNG